MIAVGIDASKDKHDCFIVDSEGTVLADVFTVTNDQIGFDRLYHVLCSVTQDLSKVRVGLEATGHYSYNLLGFLLDKGLTTYVLNPLHVKPRCSSFYFFSRRNSSKMPKRLIC